MTESKGKSLIGFIENHAWAIIAGALAIYGSYTTGQIAMAQRLEKMEARITAEEAVTADRARKLDGRFSFMNDAASRLEYLCGKDPDCRARFSPMRIPQ